MKLEQEVLFDKKHKQDVPKSNSMIREREPTQSEAPVACLTMLMFLGLICGAIYSFSNSKPGITDVPYTTIAFMNFTVLDINTRLSAKWNISIRVTENLPGSYVCLQGDFQASLLYKNITIATSPARSYSNLQSQWPQLLKVSGDIPEEDINGAIGKNIMDDIKERSEVRLGLRLILPDCRKNMIETMELACNEVMMKFDSSSQNITSTHVVGNPKCL